MPRKFTLITLFFSISLLTACGGGSGDDSNENNDIPQAIITATDEVAEGTTGIDINAADSSDDGSVVSYLWAIEDDGGIANLEIADTAGVTTQVINLPNTLDEDITIIISLIVTDDVGNDSPQVTQSITLLNDDPVVVNTGSLDGTWNSPCFNTTNNTSIEQTIIINGTSMTGDVNIYSAGSTPAFGCVLPATSTGLITAATDSNLIFGSQSGRASCVNGQAVNTSIDIVSISATDQGTQIFTSEDDINDIMTLLSFNDAGVLPATTAMCLLSNGNLLYAGFEYTPGQNNQIIVTEDDNSPPIGTVGPPANTEVLWEQGSFLFMGVDSVSDTSIVANNNLGVVRVDDFNDISFGAFGGSTIAISHTLSGTGLYNIIPFNNFDGNTPNTLSISTVVGLLTGQTTGYIANTPTTQTVEVYVDSLGRYHFTLNTPIGLDRGQDTNGGVIGAPNTLQFNMNNIHDFSN